MPKPIKVQITPEQIDAVARAIVDLRIEIASGQLPDDLAAKARRRMAELDAITVAYARAQTAARLKAARRRSISQRCETASSTPVSGRRAPLPAATAAGLSIPK